MTGGMTDPTPQPNPRGNSRDEQAVQLLRHLFQNVYCVEEDVPPPRRVDVSPMHFYGWLSDAMVRLDVGDVCAAAKVTTATWEFVQQVVASGTAIEATSAAWYLIVIPPRPAPASPLTMINVVVNATFADGRISTTQVVASPDTLPPGAVLDDANVFTFLRVQMRQAFDLLVQTGLAGLHDEAGVNQFTSSDPNDPDPFETFMGWCIAHMLRGEPMPGKLKPTLTRPVETFVRLAQKCIRPLIPARATAAFRAGHAQGAAKEDGRPRGGWNS